MSSINLCRLRTAVLVMLCCLLAPTALAQTITVKGVVIDAVHQEPVIGATVMLVEDTSKGMLTNLDGEFTLSGVPANGTIRISYVGYKTIDVPINGQTYLHITIQEDNELLDEVVVTALGIKRSEKALSYNVQELKGDALTQSANANFVNNLNGKVAGVTINTSSAGMGSAAKVVMRGTKSIEGNNNALYVIDGVPIFSTTGKQGTGQFDSMGTTESAADINPDDIESISVLTGASAAALYGSAAANGAILITTKKGQSGKVKVSVTTNKDWGRPMRMPEFQYRYGSDGGLTSWGAPIDESNKSYYRIEDFLQTAINTNNSVAVSGGTDRNQTYVSVSTTHSRGLVPNNSYERYNFFGRNTTSLLDDRLSIDLSTNYIIQKHNNMVNQGEYMNPLTSAYLMPRGELTGNVRAFERFDADRNIYVQNWSYGAGEYTLQNPYWVAYRNLRHNKRERFILSGTVSYELMNWSETEKWNVQGRIRSDYTSGIAKDSRYATTEKTLDISKNGYYGEVRSTDRQTYADLISTLNKNFEVGDQMLSLNATLGTSIQDTRFESGTVRGPLRDSGAANLFNTFNIDQKHDKAVAYPEGWIEQTQSIFGSLELGLNSYLFLTVTGRNDWASQLANSPNKSFFYPSVGLSGVITDMLDSDLKARINPVLGYLQVRASYSSVASPFQRGLTTPTLEKDFDSKGYKNITHFPIGELFPERTNSYEVGFSSKWFHNILSLGMTYYRTDTKNQTFKVEAPAGSGYTDIYLQTGMVRNQGIELSAGISVGSSDSWAFSSNFTLGYNQNEVMELADNYTNPITNERESKDALEMGGLGSLQYIIKKGGTLGDIYTNADFARDQRGDIIINKDGSLGTRKLDPNERVKLGSVLPKTNIGWSNELSYKDFSVGATLTGRFGGVVVSMTQAALDNYGVSERTAAARDLGYVRDGNIFMNPEKFFTTAGRNRMAQYFVYDATNVRVQEAHISYRLPRRWFGNFVGMHLTVYGRNLGFIYNKAPFDPEAVSGTGNYTQGLDYFMMPTQSSYGFNLKLDF
ncbi:MAG: SusC/RagA family TonB-linked outer membrane protein [Porphyromonas sp.]|nr:SusC/RagA family TonB-linked outer membrane protein [Porphyromonas sp.]